MPTGNANLSSEDFNNRIAALYQVTNCVYWFLEKQQHRDEQLLAIVKHIRTILHAAHGKYLDVFPDPTEPTKALILEDVPRLLKPLAGFMRGGATQRELEVLVKQYTRDFLALAQPSPSDFMLQPKVGG